MNSRIKSKAKQLSARRRFKSIMAKIGVVMSCVAVFCVVYVLLAPGLTVEWPLVCELEEHTHDESCYTLVEDAPAEAAQPELVCGLEEAEGHHHGDDCYTAVRGALLCEDAEHAHGDDCYEWTRELVCGLEETEGHRHGDDCWSVPEPTETETQPEAHYELTCGKEAHTHTESCYLKHEEKETHYCGYLTEHSHKDDCYFENGALKCTIPEHIHDERCLVQGEQPIFPETLPEGYMEAEVFEPTAMFALEPDAAEAPAEPETLVYVPEDAFDVPVLFARQPLCDEDALRTLTDALTEAGVAFDGLTAMDLSFFDEEGEAREPRTGPVYVKLALTQALPEAAEPELYHMTGDGPELLPADVDYDAETETLTLGFAVDSFSKFGITWTGYADTGTVTPAMTITPQNEKLDLTVYYATLTKTGDVQTVAGSGLTATGKSLSAVMAEIEAKAPSGYSVDYYMVTPSNMAMPSGGNVTVQDISYQKGKYWVYSPGERDLSEPCTVYAILKESGASTDTPDHTAVAIYINKSVQTLDASGNYTGDIHKDPGYWTGTFYTGEPITVEGQDKKYYTHLNEYENNNGIPEVYKTSDASYYITGTPDNSDTSRQSDINTRKLGTEAGYLLENERGNQTYKMQKFPTDAEIFQWLIENWEDEKSTIKDPDGHEVTKEELTPANYAIRWLSMKYNPDDLWHLDCVLVKKQGHLVVKKTFSGDQTAINTVKSGTGDKQFYISVAEDEADDKTETALYRLYLDRVEMRRSDGTYQKLAGVTPTVSADGNTYTWALDTGNVPYHIMEHNYTYNTYNSNSARVSKAISTVTEYRFTNLDPADRDEAHSENWTTFISDPGLTLTGRSYAPEVEVTDWQTVHFRNRYLPANALILHTVDGETGKPLPNVEFQVTANGERLTLWLLDDTYYFYRPQGYDNVGVTLTSTARVNEAGELIFGGVGQKDTTGIDYTFTEVSRPAGYSKAALQFKIEENGEISQSDAQKAASGGADWVTPEGSGNVYITTLRHTPEMAEITASKTWADKKDHNSDSVTLTLLKNGVPTGETLTLNGKNEWKDSFTEKYPVYGPNGRISYTVSETVNGQDAASFYVVTVARTDTVANDGKTTGIHLAVTNSESGNAGSFRFTKVNKAGDPLSGAVFTLYADSSCTTSLATLSSGEDGTVSSQLLPAGTYYLRETKAPEGYNCSGLTYTVKIQGKDSFTIDKAEGDATTGYRIVNHTSFEMPSTGGPGTALLYASGAALILLALVLMYHRKPRRKGGGAC